MQKLNIYYRKRVQTSDREEALTDKKLLKVLTLSLKFWFSWFIRVVLILQCVVPGSAFITEKVEETSSNTAFLAFSLT